MLSAYRCIIIAAGGWLTLSAAVSPNVQAKRKEADAHEGAQKAAAPITVSLSRPVEVIQSPEKAPPCGPYQYGNKDDLCAQWKAADAAAEAARWSYWSLLLAGAGTLGVLASLYYTRKAVKAAENATKDADRALEIAERNASAAMGAVEITRQNGIRDQRAYIRIDTNDGVVVRVGERIIVPMTLVNYGKTPARGVYTTGSLIPNQPGWDWRQDPAANVIPHYQPGAVLHPNSPHRIEVSSALPWPKNFQHALMRGEVIIYVQGTVRYRDVFGELRDNTFQFEYHGTDTANGNEVRFRVAPTGNDAT